MNLLVTSLMVILQTSTPASILTLDFDPSVRPIVATRLTLGAPAPSDGAFVNRAEWLRIRSAIRSLRDTCDLGVTEALGACADGIDRDRALRDQSAETLKEANAQYVARLSETQLALDEMTDRAQVAENRESLWMWIGITSLSASVVFTFAMIASQK